MAARRKPTAETYTDNGNAELLVADHADRLRYCPETGQWFSWQGTRWQAGADDSAAITAARQTVKALPDDDADAAKHKIRSLSERGLTSQVRLARADPKMQVAQRQFDADPYAVNTPTGIVDLTDGELTPHDPAGWHTKTTGVGYNPDALTPKWLTFLDGTFGSDTELIGYVQRLAGLAAIGNVTHHVLPFWHGEGSNGKSVMADVLSKVLGDYSITAPANFLLAGRDKHETEIARLNGARMVVCSEVNADSQFDEAKVKVLTGGDILTGRFMRGNFFDFVPSHTLFLMGNHQPRVSAGGTSFWRRLRLIPFLHTVPPEQRNPNLAVELVRDEGPGILAWIVDGARDLIDSGLQDPASVLAATKQYSQQEDTVARFVDEALDDIGGESRTSASLVIGAYGRWCSANHEKQESTVTLGRSLKRCGIEKCSNKRDYPVAIKSGWRPGDMRL